MLDAAGVQEVQPAGDVHGDLLAVARPRKLPVRVASQRLPQIPTLRHTGHQSTKRAGCRDEVSKRGDTLQGVARRHK